MSFFNPLLLGCRDSCVDRDALRTPCGKLLLLLVAFGFSPLAVGQLRRAAEPSYAHYDIRERSDPGRGRSAAASADTSATVAGSVPAMAAGWGAAVAGSGAATASHPSGAVYSLEGPLTTAQPGDAEDIARGFLNASRSQAGVRVDAANGSPEVALLSRSRSARLSLTHFVFQPSYGEIPYFDLDVRVHIDDQGRIWRWSGPLPLPPVPVVAEPRWTAGDAVRKTLEALVGEPGPPPTIVQAESGPTRSATFLAPALSSPAPASLTWFVLNQQALPAWQVYIDLGGGRTYWMVIDALDGRVLFSRSLVYQERPEGLVFRAPGRASPLKGPQTIEPFAGWPGSHGDCPAEVYPENFRSGPQRQRCWVADQQTVGNNADVCLDINGDNLCDRRAIAAQDRFAFPFRDSFDRENDQSPDRDAALANAFYWANALHDWLYRLGFDEAAGNFQADNFGRGGAAGDAVRIDLHDPAALNNAAFTAAPDGIAPRMELGLFPSLRRDSAFDADILAHEYVHGLTIRLIGGPSSANGLSLWQSGALGEGWSDAYAASFTGDAVIGEYASRNPATGIRTVAYDNSPYTFGRFGTLRPTVIPNSGGLLIGLPQVHRDGEIWASVLWDLRQALGRDGFEQAVTAALKLTPPRPSMLDARDAIVQSAQIAGLGGPNACGAWAVFAARGFGSSAALNPVQPGQENDTALSVYESFDLPAQCGGSPPAAGSLLLSEDAESAGSAWTPTGQWHRTSRKSASGAFSWWFGQEALGTYDTGARSRGSLTSPPLDLTAAAGAVIEWDQFLRTEGFNHPIDFAGTFGPFLNADSGRLMVSPDAGSSWWAVTHLAHPTPGDGFVRHRINLSRYVGQTIRLRFEFDTFDSRDNGYEGWYLDNIRVSRLGPEPASLSVDPPTLDFFAPSGGGAPATQTVTISQQGGSGGGSLIWTAAVTRGGAWLQMLPASGATPSTVQISAASLGLGPGIHQGEIRFQAVGQPEIATTIAVTIEVEAAGPLAAWRFDEQGRGPGITLADAEGSHPAVTAGPGTQTVAGVEGNARIFDGISGLAAVPASPDFLGPATTLRGWVKLDDYPRTLGVVASALVPSALQGWVVGVLETGNVVLMARGPTAAGPAAELLWLVSRRKLAPGQWHALAVTLDGPRGAAAMYLDGELEASAPFAGYQQQPTPLTIGRASWWDGYYLRFTIDELRLDSQAWTPAQVRADFALLDPPAPDVSAAPVAEWRFDSPLEGPEGTPGKIYDYSRSFHEALLLGNGLSTSDGGQGTTDGRGATTDGIDGQALRFDGAAGYAAVPAHADFASPGFTFSAWIQLDAYPWDWGVVFSNFDGDHRGWFAGVASDGRLILSIWGRPAFSSWVLSRDRLQLGRWHHVAVSFDDLSRRAVLYLDGKPDRSFEVAGFTPQTTVPLTLARASWFDGYYLRCTLDETKVYTVALPERDVQGEFARFQTVAPLRTVGAAWRHTGRSR